MARTAALLLVAVALTACQTTVRGVPLPERALAAVPEDFAGSAPDRVVFHYYGNGGWGIQWKGEYVMAAPYLSNDLLRVSVADRVKRGLQGTPVERARLIFAGHGHYDHVGDLPAVFGQVTGRPVVVVDETTYHDLASVRSKVDMIALKPLEHSGRWLDGMPAEIRIMPILSDHAPHVGLGHLRATLFYGRQTEDRAELPGGVADWKVGYTWAFLIDLVHEGRIAFRILYQDAAAAPLNGFPPEAERDRRRVDVNIACVPGYHLVHEYPEKLLAEVDARYVLLGHWESFFRSRDRKLAPIPLTTTGTRIDGFVTRVEESTRPDPDGFAPTLGPKGPHGANWALPIPGETLHFPLPRD
jgi:hypothetical protein